MLWVVIGHAFLGKAGKGPEWENMLFHFAYSFHMPLFMLVSGYLFYLTRLKPVNPAWGGQIWTYPAIIKDKALRLLLPGLVFSIISLAFKIAFPGEMSRQAGLSLPELAHSYLFPYDNAMRELWFIVTLFWMMLMSPIWKLVINKTWTMLGTLILVGVLHFWHPNTDFLCIQRAFSFAIWFYLGIIICKTDAVGRLFNRIPWITILVGIVIYVVGCFTHKFVTTMGGIVFSFGIALLADLYLPKLFYSFRNYTYQIFLIGIFAQMFIKIIYRHISMPYIFAYILCILVGLYVPVIISKILERLSWAPLLLCVGLKKKSK